jgi:hypothetical protein
VKLLEFMNAEELSTGFYDPSADKFNRRELSDTRKPVLTLRHLNRLKKMRALKQLEELQRQDILGIMYGIPDEPAGGGMPF